MNLLVFILLVALVLGAIAAPVVLALRRRARVAALIAGAIGFCIQALFVTYLQTATLGPQAGAFAFLVGVPVLALVVCLLSLLAIARFIKPV